MKRATFRLRLAIHTMLVAGVLVAAAGAGSWWYARQQLARNLDLRVLDFARRLWSQLTPRHTTAEMREVAGAVLGAEIEEGSAAVLVQSHAPGHPVSYASAAAPPSGFPDRLPTGEGIVTTPDDTRPVPAQRGNLLRPQMPEVRAPLHFTAGDWRHVALSSPRYTLFVGLSTRDFYAEVRRAAWRFGAVGVAALLLAGLSAWWLAGRAMRPLQRVVATAERLDAAELGEPIPIAPGDDREFAQLIAVLNAMMERLHASFQQAARFTADASHELKTPLAVMQATLHDALRSGQPPPIEALLGEVARLKSITQTLLLLSQADAGKLPLRRERYDLSADLAGLIEDAESLCAQAGLRCSHRLAPGLHVEADRTLVRHIFQNLLSNAVKHNRPGGSVEIELHARSGHAEFSIANTGPCIPAGVQPRVFERFFRGDAAREQNGGFGLGLNIAHEFARANGASLVLVESVDDRTEFRIVVALSPSSLPSPMRP